MAARRIQCWECGMFFHGRADALYCCSGCRQRAYRKRIRRRAVPETVPVCDVDDAVAKARQGRQQARATRERAAGARKRAEGTRRASTATLARVRRST
jgi:hypothetical protein